MGWGGGDHDRDTASADRGTSDPLRTSLDQLRLDGAIFLRAEYTEGWAYESPPGAVLADLLRPGATRLALFHIVARGRCWVSLGDGERHWADRGDVIVLPYGDQHRMGGTEDATCVDIGGLLAPPPWDVMPVIRRGLGGARSDVVCGYLDSDDPLFEPALRALPPLFVVRPVGAAARWVEASIDYALEASEAEAGSAASTRLPELLVSEVLRLHLDGAPAPTHGWLAALRDPVLAPAMAAMHRSPERRWTVAELASVAAVSRSVLDERFRSCLGRSPIRYLTEWRMHLADDLLATTDLGVAAVARRVGYDAEESFSRAFKRARGVSPAHWRAGRRPGRGGLASGVVEGEGDARPG